MKYLSALLVFVPLLARVSAQTWTPEQAAQLGRVCQYAEEDKNYQTRVIQNCVEGLQCNKLTRGVNIWYCVPPKS